MKVNEPVGLKLVMTGLPVVSLSQVKTLVQGFPSMEKAIRFSAGFFSSGFFAVSFFSSTRKAGGMTGVRGGGAARAEEPGATNLTDSGAGSAWLVPAAQPPRMISIAAN